MADKAARLRFPRIRRVELKNFSLYSRKPDIVIDVPPGVLCVAGANGVGKSTFLSTVNFAITARVPTPRRSYSSANEYFQNSLPFTKSFFEGRVTERDREAAAVKVRFIVGDELFDIERGLFEPGGLRSFTMEREARSGLKTHFDGADLTDEERQDQFSVRLSQAIGVKTFQQFVFLQHFVLTFDESRSLLFWDEKALDAALFLAFGKDPEEQEQADQLRRDMEKLESKARNSKWQSLRVKTQLDQSKAAYDQSAKPKDIAELEAEFDARESERDVALQELHQAELKVRDAELKFIDASARAVALRHAYGRLFAKHVGDRSRVSQHPLVVETITGGCRCAICGADGRSVAEAVERKLATQACPLCDTPFSKKGRQTEDFAELERLDAQLEEVQKSMILLVRAQEREVASLDAARKRAVAAEEAISSFETTNESAVKWIRGAKNAETADVEAQIRRLEAEMNRLVQQSKAEYDERNKLKARLQRLQQGLATNYKITEQRFVPLFKELAERFLGMELDISVESHDVHTSLVLELKSNARRQHHQLSESQRFFLDIALRMALAQFASAADSRATLFVDTPEGSLDIAYEARAGEMFARFVKSGHDILMTANVNTSQLLRKLARASGPKAMVLAKMTEWGDLSDVQLEEEALFDEAYLAIESELTSSKAGVVKR